jgi:O-antigen/teichoic acid export membrane protein
VLFFGPVLGYLTGPIFSELESKDEYEKLNKLYTITARWLVVLTFPIFSIVLLAPELLLGTVFGEQYRTAGFAVLILISGQFLTRPVGLSDRVLMAKGETKIIMYITFTMAGLNIGLNIILIPIYGVVGAAITTAVAGLLKNSGQAVYIYYSSDIHPFANDFIYPTIIVVSVLSGTKILFSSTQVSLFQLFIIVGILFCFYLLCLLITRSIYTIELKLADSFLKQLGIQLNLENRLSVFTKK